MRIKTINELIKIYQLLVMMMVNCLVDQTKVKEAADQNSQKQSFWKPRLMLSYPIQLMRPMMRPTMKMK